MTAKYLSRPPGGEAMLLEDASLRQEAAGGAPFRQPFRCRKGEVETGRTPADASDLGLLALVTDACFK